jgi:non-lysosomal glucosylceramidase
VVNEKSCRTTCLPEATREVQAAIDDEPALAKVEFERVFWNPTTARYRFCDGTGGITGLHGTIFGHNKPVLPPDAIHLESFYAQGIAMQLGLPDLINIQHARAHLHNVLDKFLRFRDADGNILGAPLVLDPHFNDFGLALRTTEIREVLPGVVYMAAAGDDADRAKNR